MNRRPRLRPPGRRVAPRELDRARRRQQRRAAATEVGSAGAAPEGADLPGTGSAGAPAASVNEHRTSGTPRGRLVHALLHPGRGQVLAAVILFVVGLGGVMQIRSNQADATYATARREDLVQLLDGLTSESRTLETEVNDLERTRTTLQSGADSRSVARQEAAQRIAALSILAGTVPARGPGIRITITAPPGKVTANVLLDALEELRDAGAEVVEYNDAVRVVASTSFTDGPDGVVVDGTTLHSPYTIEAIGDGYALAEAANFRGGLVSEVTGPGVGGRATVLQLHDVRIDSLHTVVRTQYAQPAASATPR